MGVFYPSLTRLCVQFGCQIEFCGCVCPVVGFAGGVAAAFIGCAWTGVSGCVIAMSAPTHGQDGCYGGFDIESKLSRAYMYV